MPPKRSAASQAKEAAKASASQVKGTAQTAKRVAEEQAQEGEEHGYEFGGPIGAALISFGLPIGCYAFAFLCNDVTGCPAPALLSPSRLFSPPSSDLAHAVPSALTLSSVQPSLAQRIGYVTEALARETGWPGWTALLSWQAVAGTLAWYALSLVLYRVLPATEAEGVELMTGGRLKYRFNTFLTALTIFVACAAGTIVNGPDFVVWRFINQHFIEIITTNILISYALATYIYLRSFSVRPSNTEQRELAAGGHTGNLIYDWYIGRELNPRITVPFFGEIDIKSFMELRPGMIGWILLDLAFMAKQYKSYGYITDSMLVVTISQAIYVLDALWMESAILTTIDITTDGFGFMLAFGDLVWLPFTYSISARYLSVHPVVLGPVYLVAILGIQGFGYYIFRAANNEKNRFRTDPSDPRVTHLKYIETASGSRLLASGWWGTARHINYLGDWLMSWAYCLPTLAAGYKLTPSLTYPGTRLVSQGDWVWNGGMAGAAIPITYFYMLYFAILLIHRESRDEEKCRRKYGRDWDMYCQQVKWRIWPGVY